MKHCVPLAAALTAAALLAAPNAAATDARPLTLSEAIALALANSPAGSAAAAAAEAARAGVERAGAEDNLQVRLDSRFVHASEAPTMPTLPGAPRVTLAEKDSWITSLNVVATPYTGGRVAAALDAAGKAAEAAEAEWARSLQVVSFTAERAFYLLLAAQNALDAARRTLSAASDHERTAQARFEARAAAWFDVMRAQVQVQEARHAVIQAEGGLVTANAHLLQALGLSEGSLAAIDPAEAFPPRPPVDELVAVALASRPDLAATAAREGSARALIGAAAAERRPSASLGGAYQVVEPESLMSKNQWTLSASVSVPIFDGGRARAKSREAQALLARAVSAREALALQIAAEVRRAYAGIETADAQVEVAGKRTEQAAELLRLAEVRYASGAGTPTEVADALAAFTNARQGLVRAIADRGIAGAELRLAMGVQPGEAGTPREGSR